MIQRNTEYYNFEYATHRLNRVLRYLECQWLSELGHLRTADSQQALRILDTLDTLNRSRRLLEALQREIRLCQRSTRNAV